MKLLPRKRAEKSHWIAFAEKASFNAMNRRGFAVEK